MYKEIAKPPEKLNKTRGIGIIAAPPELVAAVVADDYEAWDDSIKDLKTLTSERDPGTGALVEICWSRYCLRESLLSPVRPDWSNLLPPSKSYCCEKNCKVHMSYSSRPQIPMFCACAFVRYMQGQQQVLCTKPSTSKHESQTNLGLCQHSGAPVAGRQQQLKAAQQGTISWQYMYTWGQGTGKETLCGAFLQRCLC